jgi:hypothetical protein
VCSYTLLEGGVVALRSQLSVGVIVAGGYSSILYFASNHCSSALCSRLHGTALPEGCDCSLNTTYCGGNQCAAVCHTFSVATAAICGWTAFIIIIIIIKLPN